MLYYDNGCFDQHVCATNTRVVKLRVTFINIAFFYTLVYSDCRDAAKTIVSQIIKSYKVTPESFYHEVFRRLSNDPELLRVAEHLKKKQKNRELLPTVNRVKGRER